MHLRESQHTYHAIYILLSLRPLYRPQAGAEVSYTFACSGEAVAIAILGDYGILEEYEGSSILYEYIKKHCTSWYNFAMGKGHLLELEHIIFVSGTVKTSSWAVATCGSADTSHALSFSADAASLATAKFSVSSEHNVRFGWQYHVGPACINPHLTKDGIRNAGLPNNQCMFLKGYRLKSNVCFPLASRIQEITQDDGEDLCEGQDGGKTVFFVSNLAAKLEHTFHKYLAWKTTP